MSVDSAIEHNERTITPRHSARISGAVDLVPSQEELSLREAVRSLVTAQGDIEEIRRLADTERGYSTELWSELTDSMAVTSMAVPETDGGLGYGFGFLAAVIEECGRALRPEPIISTAAVGLAALALGDDERVGTLRSEALVGRAVIAASPLTDGSDQLTAVRDLHTSEWRLAGSAHHIADGAVADIVIVTALTDTGRALFALPRQGDRAQQVVSVERHVSLDPTRPLATITCDGAAAMALTEPDRTESAVANLRNRALIALASENVGICDRLFEMTREHTLSRKQFGRQIASYQAIKHRLADMLLDLERARSAARYAVAYFDLEPSAADLAAATAAAVCADAAHRIATEAIQLHGGIGFTWEHPAHNYYRRVLTNETLYGDATAHRQRIADQLGLG